MPGSDYERCKSRTLDPRLKQRLRKIPPFGQRQWLRVRREDLNANVVGARGVMFANAVPDHVEVAPGDDRVDQPVAAVLDIGFAEPQPEKVVDIVRRLQIELEEFAADLPRFRG